MHGVVAGWDYLPIMTKKCRIVNVVWKFCGSMKEGIYPQAWKQSVKADCILDGKVLVGTGLFPRRLELSFG
jgi:hypothetical protein